MYEATGGLAGRLFSTVQATTAIASDPHLPETLCLVDRLSPGPSKGIDVKALASDPHLSEVVCHVLHLKGLEEGKRDMKPCAQIPTTRLPGKGVGLRYAIKPLRFLVMVREQPLIGIGIGVGVIGGLVGIGYLLGRVK